ncbi:MAG: tRNA (adenosine(37)-N6)-threonylcarbamoyltransferase complex transferase subunit TsaD [Pseudomonadota bacterium]
MLCLGIESSCDETALALVRDGKLVHSIMSTQADVHALFGGVVPELASREHYRLIGPLYDALMTEAGCTLSDIDAIAVARGPGLLGALLVGMAFAKGLALSTGIPLIGVHHLHAHLLAAGLDEDLEYPALGLLVSGGHTHIYRIDAPDSFTLMGKTLDDAAGEAYDKVAKMLGLPYPGGRHLDEAGRKGIATPKLFPRPYLDNDTLDFSFSGLKTALQSYIMAHPDLVLDHAAAQKMCAGGPVPQALADMCASFNLAVAETLCTKLGRALHRPESHGVKAIIVAGGVAANSFVREHTAALAERHHVRHIVPKASLCTDNGSMIAFTGWELAKRGLYHGLDVEAIPRGRTIPHDYLCASCTA